MIKLIAVLVIASLGFTAVQTQEELKCNACLAENEALCASETSYYLCFDGESIGGEQQCPGDTVCSNAEAICVPKTQISETVKNVCGDASIGGCAKCIAGNRYTCVSPTQAARCVNNQIAAVINCKGNEICIADVGVGSVCVPQSVAAYLGKNATCNEDAEYTTPTPAPSTTPSPDERSRICDEASAGVTRLFFYAYADESCKNGVYCQRSSLTSTDWTTFYRPCSAPTPYFNTLFKSCVATKPTNCPVPVSTTTAAPVPTTTTTPVPTTTTTPVPTTTTTPVPTTTTTPVPTTTTTPVPSTPAAPVSETTTALPSDTTATVPSDLDTTATAPSDLDTTATAPSDLDTTEAPGSSTTSAPE